MNRPLYHAPTGFVKNQHGMYLNQIVIKPAFLKALIVLCSLLILFTSRVEAQLKGRIIDAQTKETLIGALISNILTNNGTISDRDGKFELVVIESKGTLQISFLGYQTKEINYSNKNNDLGTILLFSESILSEGIIVNAQRLDASTPMAFKTVTSEDLEKVNLGQDLPYLIQMTPSVLSSSDAGAGVGYTYMSIRGVDQARINVTINGIPVNDSESHGVWWVNMPDFSSSVESIQIQRGVGSSTNGAAAFGASINMETSSLKAEPFASVATTQGSFNTQKYSAEFGTGLLKSGWAFDARLSQIQSDGYIDRAKSDLSSYFLNATYSGKEELVKINVFSGKEKTYQAWYGTPEALVFGNDADVQSYIDRNGWSLQPNDITNLQTAGRRYNYYTYDDEADNYEQHHYQIHYSKKWTEQFNSSISFHLTKGSGYYESYKVDASFGTYNLNPVEVNGVQVSSSDLIRREWLENDFYGFTFGTEWLPNKWTSLKIGGAANQYDGDHFGEVIWAQYMGNSPIRNKYYDNTGNKTDLSAFAKLSQTFGDFITYVDVQFRHIFYEFEGFDRLPTNQISQLSLSDPLFFFNPKIGLTWSPDQTQKAFISFSVANKEATRNEYVNSVFDSRPKHETLYDLELGYQKAIQKWQFEAIAYFMNYKNQLIETGAINDVGEYVRQNVAHSYRSGLEFSIDGKLTNEFRLQSSLALSRNRVKKLSQYMDNYDVDYVNDLPVQVETILNDTPLSLSPELNWSSSVSYSTSRISVEWMTRVIGIQYLDNSGSESKSIPSFWVNDFRLGYDLPLTQGKLNVSLLVNNVLNELYAPRGYTYSYVAGGEVVTENFYYPQAERHILAQVKYIF